MSEAEYREALGKDRVEMASFYFWQRYGFASPPSLNMPVEHSRTIMRFYLAVAKADGIASADEIQWLKRHSLCVGMTQEIIDKVYQDAFNPEALDNEEEIMKDIRKDPHLSKLIKILVFQCLECAGADGLDEREIAAVRKFAVGLGLTQEEIDAILDLYSETYKLQLKKIKVLGLTEHPMLEPRMKDDIAKLL